MPLKSLPQAQFQIGSVRANLASLFRRPRFKDLSAKDAVTTLWPGLTFFVKIVSVMVKPEIARVFEAGVAETDELGT